MSPHFWIALVIGCTCYTGTQAVLQPQDSVTRFTKSLDGLWHFWLLPNHNESDPLADLRPAHSSLLMPVPASFNDIPVNDTIRRWAGWVAYQTSFHVPDTFIQNHSVYIHFASVHYRCSVYVNNQLVATHVGGHLPFNTQVTNQYLSPRENQLLVLVNNQLSADTIPQAIISKPVNSSHLVYPDNYTEIQNTFDFFNYAGIHRPVHLCVVPKNHIHEITWSSKIANPIEEDYMYLVPMEVLGTDFDMLSFAIDYQIEYKSINQSLAIGCTVNIIDQASQTVKTYQKCAVQGEEIIVRLWNPIALVNKIPYLYTIQVQLWNEKGRQLLDEYNFTTGFRTIKVKYPHIMVNGRNVYLAGFGRHEDSPIIGRGFSPSFNVHDHNLLQWIGANCYRTSHYPYSEQLMQMADQQGLLIINELPAVSLNGFQAPLLQLHLQMLRELIQRDGHRPSTLMWSIANEPVSANPKADAYFKTVAQTTRQLDPTRPVTAAIATPYDTDLAGPHLDVIMINRYFSWYSDPGHLDLIPLQMSTDVQRWNDKHHKPMVISEYGVDTIPGAHSIQPLVFSEEYQQEFLQLHFDTFDQLRAKGQLTGEMIWNFADFMTDASITRVMGNRKGIFTRDRQPKKSAYLVRNRYHRLQIKSN